MLSPARTPEHRLGVLVRPPLELGNGNEPKLAAPDQPQLGLDMALERVQRHPERHRRLLATAQHAGHSWMRYSRQPLRKIL